MAFDYIPTGEAGLLAAFAEATGSVVINGLLTLADELGQGYIRGFDLNPSIRMMVHCYTLTDELVFRRSTASAGRGDTITITFHNVLVAAGGGKNGREAGRTGNGVPAVQITSAGMDFETVFPANTPVNTIIIAVRVAFLAELVQPHAPDSFLQTLVSGTQPYVYEALSSPKIQDTAAQIMMADVPEPLRTFYYRLRAEELIYLFLRELTDRQLPGQSVQPADVKRIYAIRNRLAADLSVPPNLPKLARFAGLSESKLTRLFRQIFGSSVYTYYQTLRMHEAAHLIREQLSISEAGYRLGFSNLSHFSRLFKRHYGMTPKRFAMNR